MFYNNSYITGRRKITYTYNVTTPAVNLPLTLAEVKTHLRLDPDDTSEDSQRTTAYSQAVQHPLGGDDYVWLCGNYCTNKNLDLEQVKLLGWFNDE
jgi:hypothetical protein